MIQPITLLTAGIFFAVLYSRFRSRPQNAPARSRRQRLKMVKVLLAALLVWMAVTYSLRHTIDKMDGVDREPSLMERIVSFLSSK
jgi:uncharacterized membrane-anchored protein